eukprot:scaffold3380_cov50-Attheya_sp.AAC.5
MRSRGGLSAIIGLIKVAPKNHIGNKKYGKSSCRMELGENETVCQKSAVVFSVSAVPLLAVTMIFWWAVVGGWLYKKTKVFCSSLSISDSPVWLYDAIQLANE